MLRAHPFSGINRKVQLKPVAWETRVGEDGSKKEVPVEALFILKWGGELTKLGEAQAEFLGGRFRNSLYPGDEDGGGVLRLHSTYRHDLKIYSSDEGRVQTTAAAFTKVRQLCLPAAWLSWLTRRPHVAGFPRSRGRPPSHPRVARVQGQGGDGYAR